MKSSRIMRRLTDRINYSRGRSGHQHHIARRDDATQNIGFCAQGLTRPLCPYPQYADYKGSGDLKDGANWACKSPAPQSAKK